MAKVLQLKQQLQCIKKGTNFVSEFMLKVKSVGDALKVAGEFVRDNDLILSILNGIGREYNLVAVLIFSQKQTMSLQKVHCQLMVHRQRIAHLNSTSHIDVVNARVNFAARNANVNRSTSYYATPKVINDTSWYSNSGATNHVTADLSNLSIQSEYKGGEKPTVRNGQ
ncbi:hypothetical protein ACOSP7_016867 [Xanthoceras sorbifolium]